MSTANTFVHFTEHMSPDIDGRGTDVFNIVRRLTGIGEQFIISGKWVESESSEERRAGIQIFRVSFDKGPRNVPWTMRRYLLRRSLVRSLLDKLEQLLGGTHGITAIFGHHMYGGLAAARAAECSGIPAIWVLYGTMSAYGLIPGLEETALLNRYKPHIFHFLILENGSSIVSKMEKILSGGRLTVFNQAVSDEFTKNAYGRESASTPTECTGVFTYISTSSMIKCKGVGYTIKAFEKIHREQNSRLILLGDGPLRPRYENLVARKGLSKRVRFFGRVPPVAVREELLNSDVLVAASPNNSNFERSVLEAMSLGLPVIVTDAGRTSELLTDGENCVLVRRKNAESLAEAMNNVYVDAALRRRLRKKGMEFAKNLLSWDKRMRSFREVVAELTGQREDSYEDG